MDAGSGAGALRDRVVTAVIGLPIVLLAVWVGGVPLFLLASIVAAASAVEVRRLLLAPAGGLLYVTVALAAALQAAAFLGAPLWPQLAIGGIAGGLLLRRALTHRRGNGPLAAGGAAQVAGPLYPAAFLSFGVALHDVEVAGTTELGARWLLAALLLVFASDTSAYFVGRVLGSHRLAPRISPRKTWEGAIGGVLGASAACALLSMALPLRSDGPLDLMASGELAVFAALGAGVSVLAQAGDLFMSAVKRTSGAKESGSLLPGHGGFLDRLDSVLPVLPAVYYGLQWVS